MFLSIAYLFLLIHNTLVQTYVSKIHRHTPCLPPRKKIDGASSPFTGRKNRGAGFRFPKAGAGSDGKGRSRGSPFLIFPSNPSASTTTAPPQRQRGRCCEDAGEKNSVLKESSPPPPPPPPGAKHTQWKPLIMRAVGSLESRPCMLHSQLDHRKNCVYPARDIAWAGRNTQSVT